MYWKILLLCLPLLLLGGRTSHGKLEWVHWLKPIDETSFTTSNVVHVPPCIGRPGHGEELSAATARHACYPSATHDFRLTRFGIVVTQPLSSNDDCQIVLVAHDTPGNTTGTEIAASSIMVGDGNTDANCGRLDTIGEFCMLDLPFSAGTLVNAGGWYSILIDDATVGTCSELTGVQAVVWGYFP